MSESLRVLILEDNPADVELIQFELEDARLVFSSKVVMTEEDFVQELQKYCPDIILSDYDLPKYNGALALAEAKRRCPDTPFILVTGAVTEDRAIEILTKGAKDYVLKHRLQQRLAPAVRRALAEAEEQRARKKAEEELREAHRSLESQVAERTADLQKEIEHRYRVEQSLLRYNEQIELLSYTASRLLASDKPQQVLEELCLKVMEFLDCDAFFNFLVDEAAGRLHLNACAGIPKETMCEIEWLDYGVAVSGCAARDACRIVAENIPITPDVRTGLVKSFGIKAYACHPLMEQNRVLGTLSFGTRSRTTFSADDLAMMKAVADQVAIATSRVRTENALRESESVLRAFFDSPGQPRGVVEVLDDKMRFVSVNKLTAAAYGLTPETMRGKFVSELDIPLELMQVYLEGCKGALQKGLVSFEVFHQLPDTGRWFVVTGSYLGNGPTGFPRFAFVMLDITKRKKAEEKMRESEERYRLLAETMLQGVVHQDAMGKIIAMNPAAELILGKNREQFLVSSSVDEERHTIRENGEQFPGLEHPSTVALRTGLPVKGVVMGLFSSNLSDYRWITIDAVPIFRPGDASPSEVYSVFEDITRRKKAEETLRQSEKRYRTLFNGMTEGFAIHEIITDEQDTPVDYRFLDINPAFERLTGLKRKEVVGKTHNEVLRGDDPKWLRMFGAVALSGEPVQFENYSPALNRHYEVLAYRPAPRQFAVIFMDITTRKLAEEELAGNQVLLRAIIDGTSDPVYVKDCESRIITANDALAKVVGKPLEEIIGKTDSEYYGDAAVGQMLREHDLKIMASDRSEAMEEVIQTPTGSRIFLSNKAPYRNANGEIIGIIGISRDITERKHVEEKLRESEQRYRNLVQYAPAGIYDVDFTTGRFTEVNDVMCQILGYTRDELLAMTAADILGDEGKALFASRISRAQSGDQPHEVVEYQVRTKEGRLIWAILDTKFHWKSGRIVGATVVSHDITDRKRAEGDLRKAKAELEQRVKERTAELQASSLYARSLIEASVDPLVTISADGKIMDVNHASEEITGISRRQLIGRDFSDYFTEPEKARAGYEEVFRNGFVRDYPLELMHRDGHVTPVLYNASVYRDETGKVVGVFAAARDITERKRAEEALQRAYGELEKRVEERTLELTKRRVQIEEANKELESSSYSVSHDLRAPLRAIDGYSRMILRKHAGRFDDDAIEKFNVIRDSTRMMGQLIDDLLAFSRAGRAELSTVAIDIGGLIREVWKDLKATNPDRLLTLKLDEIPPCKGDQALIKQVLVNILSNAVKFTRGRAEARIEVGGDNKDGKTVYYIRDNGAGFDMQYHDKLFGVFQRLHSDGEFEGTGVGLAIVQRIINRHGGRIWAEGEVDKGATFYFSLPADNGSGL